MWINPSEHGHAQGSCTPSVPASDFTSKLLGFLVLPLLHAAHHLQHRNAPIFHENQPTLACPWNTHTHTSISSDLSRTKAKSDSMAFRGLWRAFKHSRVYIAVKTGKM